MEDRTTEDKRKQGGWRSFFGINLVYQILVGLLVAILGSWLVQALTNRRVFAWLGESLSSTLAIPPLIVGFLIATVAWSLGRRAPEESSEPTTEALPPTIDIKVPYISEVTPGGGGHVTRKVEVLTGGERRVDWAAFHRGIDRLHAQCHGWCEHDDAGPDMIAVGINRGGVTIADMLGGNDAYVLGVAYTASKPQKGRCLERLALPELRRPPGEYKVLLVDMVMKTGSSLEVVKEGLVAMGFDEGKMRAAIFAFVNPEVTEPGAGASPLALSPEHFKRSERQEPGTYRPWLKRLYYVAFLSAQPIIYPWDTWDGA